MILELWLRRSRREIRADETVFHRAVLPIQTGDMTLNGVIFMLFPSFLKVSASRP